MMFLHRTIVLVLSIAVTRVSCFAPAPLALASGGRSKCIVQTFSISEIMFLDEGEDDDDEEDEEEEDPYSRVASSEFLDEDESSRLTSPTTSVDWGGAIGKLRDRIDDQESGSVGPSKALFRLMTSHTPNEAINTFVSQASPQVVTAMSGAVSSLLGGLTNPAMGVETLVKASGEKIGNLCFQLQMTGYMFRNAAYVLALKDLMNLHGSANLQDYKNAFDRLDKDGSGFIESAEVEALLQDVYGEERTPAFEVDSFLHFFDSNKDGRVSWEEFEQGLGAVEKEQNSRAEFISSVSQPVLGPSAIDGGGDDEIVETLEPSVSGVIDVELDDGTTIKVQAKEYVKALKNEAESLKKALRLESGSTEPGVVLEGDAPVVPQSKQSMDSIASYIASLQGDVQTLTKGISPEVVEAMRMLVDYVIDGSSSRKSNGDSPKKEEIEMEIPGSALQQLALWQLVLGYRLRESEATGDYLRLLE